MNPNEQGQTLLEGLFAILAISLILIASSKVFYTAWVRLECDRKLFDATRNQLNQSSFPSRLRLTNGVWIRRQPDGVQGSITCGNFHRSLFLPNL